MFLYFTLKQNWSLDTQIINKQLERDKNKREINDVIRKKHKKKI